MSEFEDKVAVITGGARGFGKAFAEALAARGAKIALIDLDQPAAEETAVGRPTEERRRGAGDQGRRHR